MKYRPDIDGLRSVAVIPVVLFHLGYDWINGGYFGVDVFFVISGFLITSILNREITTASFSMKEFWLRRVRRILPAVIAVVLTTLLIAPFLIFRGDLVSLTSDSVATLFSYANFQMLFKFGDYWGSSAESSFFLHGWSLAVEEQFYIFYPLLLLLLYKWRKSWSTSLAILILFSLGLFVYGTLNYPTATFYMLPTRAWELAAGGIIAVLPRENHDENKYSFLSSVLSVLGLLMILSSFFIFTGEEGINFYAILPVLGAVLVIGFSTGQNIVGQLLSSAPFVFIGKISYSLYLWHWPIIVLLHNYYITKFPFWQLQCIAVLLTLLFSVMSYYFVENKTRRWKHTPRLVLIFIVIIVSYIFLLRSSLVKKDYDSPFDAVVFHGLFYNITPSIDKVSEVNKEKRKGTIVPERPSEYEDSYKKQGIITHQEKESVPQVVVLGDSHGAMWGKIIDEITELLAVKTSFYTAVGASPFFNLESLLEQHKVKGFSAAQRRDYAQTFWDNLKTWRPKLLIVSCRWDSMNEDNMRYFSDLIDQVNSYGTTVLILTQPPIVDVMGDRNTTQYLTFMGYQPNDNSQYIQIHSNPVRESNDLLREQFDSISNVVFFDAYSPYIRDNGTNEVNVLIVKGKEVLYYDDDHLSYQGTQLVKEELYFEIDRLLNINK